MDEQQQQPQDESFSLDFAELVERKHGWQVLGRGSDEGSVRVKVPQLAGTADSNGSPEDPDGSEQEINIAEYMDKSGLNKQLKAKVDPSKIKIEIGSAAKPLPENPMGFLDRVGYAQARKPSDKLKYLQEKFGQGNVEFNAETKEFSVRQGNSWHSADPGVIAGFIGQDGGALAGGIAGAKAGAMAGTAIFPGAGTIAGGIGGLVVGAVGAGLGKYALNKVAESSGIRSEQDMVETTAEIGKEIIVNLAFGAGGQALATGGRYGIKGVQRALKVLDQAPDASNLKRFLANTLTTVSGTKDGYKHFTTWFNNVDDVSAHLQDIKKHELITAAGKEAGPNPVRRKMAELIQNVVPRAKKAMNTAYNSFYDDAGTQTVLKNAKVDAQKIAGEYGPMFRDAIEKAESAADKKHLQRVYDIFEEAVYGGKNAKSTFDWAKMKAMPPQPKGPLSFDKAKEIRQRLDDILEESGAYAETQFQITDRARGLIKGVRNSLKSGMEDSIMQVNKYKGIEYKAMNASYSARRELLDDLAKGRFLDDLKVDTNMKRLGGEQGERLRETIFALASEPNQAKAAAAGFSTWARGLPSPKGNRAGEEIMRQFDTMNSALAVSGMFRSGQGIGKLQQVSGKVMGGVTARGLNFLAKAGSVSQELGRMSNASRKAIWANAGGLQQLTSSAYKAFEQEEQMVDQLVSQGVERGQ